MGDAVDGGCTPGRARGGARGDFSTDGVAKAAQLFLDDLSARMQRMDKPPQASFRHSYGGEFEVRCAIFWGVAPLWCRYGQTVAEVQWCQRFWK